MRTWTKGIFAVAVTVASVGIGVVGVTGTATASGTPYCNNYAERTNGAHTILQPVYNSTNFSCNLDGAHPNHNATVALQQALNDCNLHAGLTVDGSYGTLTANAVKAVQTDANNRGYHLTVDGEYGPQTAIAMTWKDELGKCIGQ